MRFMIGPLVGGTILSGVKTPMKSGARNPELPEVFGIGTQARPKMKEATGSDPSGLWPWRHPWGSGGYFTPDSRLFLAYSSLSAALTENKFVGPGVLAAGAASGFFAW